MYFYDGMEVPDKCTSSEDSNNQTGNVCITNIETCLHNHCCLSKVACIKYYEFVSVVSS